MTEGLTKDTGHPVRYVQILFIKFLIVNNHTLGEN